MTKLYLKPIDHPEADWQELVGTVVKDSITVSGPEFIPDIAPNIGHFQFTFHCRIKRKTEIRLMQLAGFKKSPKCTYRTVKRGCAKRNMI